MYPLPPPLRRPAQRALRRGLLRICLTVWWWPAQPSTSGRSRAITGEHGAGTIFFSGCNLELCVLPKRGQISHENFGTFISESRLYELFQDLAAQGAACLDLVTPTHFAHILARVLSRPVPGGLPVVWNCGGYDAVSALRALEGKVDIYLPDLKYLSPGARWPLFRRFGLSPGGPGRDLGDVPPAGPCPV